MKKPTLLFASFPFILHGFSQTKWELNGNNSGSNDFIGTTNNQSLVFKTDNTVRLKIQNDGDVVVKNLESLVGHGIVKVNGNGKLGRVDYPSNPEYFFDGTSNFSPISNICAWVTSGNFVTLDASKKVGVGISNPTYKFEVLGDAKIHGVLHIRDSIHVGDSSVWMGFGLNGAFLYSDLLGSIPPSHFNGALQINGKANSPNTFINQGNGKLYVGTASNNLVYGANINSIYHAIVKQGLLITGNNGTQAFRGGKQVVGSTPTSISPNTAGDIAIEFLDLPGGDIGCTNPIKGLNFYRPFPHDAGFSNYNFFISTHKGNAGNIGVGTPYPKYKFSVEGTIGCREVIVETASWCDFVFEPNYKLLSLDSLREYITINQHLPHIPSETEIIANGIETSKILMGQMQTIEEIILYILDLEKQIKELREALLDKK